LSQHTQLCLWYLTFCKDETGRAGGKGGCFEKLSERK